MTAINRLQKRPQRPLRVLHCPLVALYQPPLLSKGLRRLGIAADSMIFDKGEDGWLSFQEDINLGLDECGSWQKLGRLASFFIKAAKYYDIFHFHSGRSLQPLWVDSRWSPIPKRLRPRLSRLRHWDFVDLPLLKKMGKKLIFSFWGCDIRKPTHLRRYPDYICNDHCRCFERQCATPFRKNLVQAVKKYSDSVLLSGDLIQSWPTALWLPNAIDLNEFNPQQINAAIPAKYRVDKNGRVLVLHAFANSGSRGDHKGSPFIKKSIQNLIRKGLKIKFINLDGVPIQDVKYYQIQADIVVDQFRLGCYGSFAMESMALGRPVVGWVAPEIYQSHGPLPPIVNTDLNGLTHTLSTLVKDRPRREAIGKLSRGYVKRVHDHHLVVNRLKQIYEDLYTL